ncbi:phosphogluconate dehydrogenase C-terminal domain-containing protein [Saccharomonospora sp. NPDC006951]
MTTVTVVGAGGKMGQRVSNNLAESAYRVLYSENSLGGRELLASQGREVTDSAEAARESDVVILAVPDVVLGTVSEALVPELKPGAIVLTLDPAAAYAGLLHKRDDIEYAVAHPCHPSVFLERTTKEEYADTFGGVAAPQEVVAAFESGNETARKLADDVIRVMYAPVVDVHWVSVKQLAVLEPTLVETVACMVGSLLNEALHETVHTVGVPEPAARAMLLGHVQVALTNTLRGSNPFSDACLIAMDYGRETIVKDDWKKIFDDGELDKVIARMLKIDAVKRS